MPMQVGISTGRWNDQEFDLCPYRTCMSEQFNLIHLELVFVSLDVCFLECLLVDCNTNSSAQILQNISYNFSYCMQYWNFRGFYPIWIISITLNDFMYMWTATHVLQNISRKVMYVEPIVFIIKLYYSVYV